MICCTLADSALNYTFFADVMDRLTGGDVMTIIMFGLGGTVAVIAIIFGAVKNMVNTRERETTRREIAAYVAEGSIKPEDAVAMLKAGDTVDRRTCT